MSIGDNKKLSELKQELKALFASQLLCVLSTDDRGQPYSNLVAFAETNDLRSLVFATKRGTRKYSNTLSNRNVAMLVDGRTNTNLDFAKAVAVTVLGSVEEVPDIDGRGVTQIFLSKHPLLNGFLHSKNSALMIVNVKALIVASFSETTVIPFDI